MTRRWIAAMSIGWMLLMGCQSKPKAAPPAATKPDTGPIASTVPPTTTAPAEAAPPRDWSAENAAVYARLDVVLPEVRFDGVPLTDVFDFLRDFSGVKIFVNWRALEAAGIDRNKTKVAARLRDVKFSKALETILRDVGGGVIPLGYVVDAGVITISTQQDLRSDLSTAVYDIRALLPAQDPVRKQIAEQVMTLIPETVTWDANCNIRELNGQLIVVAPPQTHQQVRRLVAQLHESRAIAGPRP